MHLGMIWIISLRNVLVFSTIDDQEVIILVFLYSIFSCNMLVLFFNLLQPLLKKKIELARDACSIPPIIIKSHDLHVNDIRGVVHEISSYHMKDQLFPFFGSSGLYIFWPFFGLPFCLLCDGSNHWFFIYLSFCEIFKYFNIFIYFYLNAFNVQSLLMRCMFRLSC